MSSAALSNAQLTVHLTLMQVNEVVKQSGAVEKVITIPREECKIVSCGRKPPTQAAQSQQQRWPGDKQ